MFLGTDDKAGQKLELAVDPRWPQNWSMKKYYNVTKTKYVHQPGLLHSSVLSDLTEKFNYRKLEKTCF